MSGMALSPLAIALQGIGFGAHLTAVQGFALIDDAAAPPPISLVITRAWLQRMRSAREALRVSRQAARKTRRELDEEADELERRLNAQSANAAAAAAQAQAAIAQAAAHKRHARRRAEADLLVLLGH